LRGLYEGKDQLVVMGTGAGKSLCYQIPPLVIMKTAIVISPLISLMQDQVMALNAKNITACYLGSAQTDRSAVLRAWQGEYMFIYMSPEYASNAFEEIKTFHLKKGLSLVAIDESHCVSEWGFDFRPSFRDLGKLKDMLMDVPLVALTATATQIVRNDIMRSLHMRSDAAMIVDSFERSNLFFEVHRKKSLHACLQPVIQAAEANQLEPTIIYCISKRETEEAASILLSIPILANKVGVYHGDLSIERRDAVHHRFLRDICPVVCCTIAFGMGIDKKNVRTIIHWGLPATIEAYYQGAGRAGRDGLPSRCILCWSEVDAATQVRLKSSSSSSASTSSNSHPNPNPAVSSILSYCMSNECRHAIMVNYFAPGSFLSKRCTGGCDNCFAKEVDHSSMRNIADEMRCLLSAINVAATIRKAILLLRGSGQKDVTENSYLMQATTSDGKRCYGSGKDRSEDWWKGLEEIAINEKFVVKEMRQTGGSSSGYAASYLASLLTPAGRSFMQSQDPLIRRLTPDMRDIEEKEILLAATRATALAECQARDNLRKSGGEKLLSQLQDLRGEIASSTDLPPEMVISDAALQDVLKKRPKSIDELRSCEGCGSAFIDSYGKIFIDTIVKAIPSNRSQLSIPEDLLAGKVTVEITTESQQKAKSLLTEPKGAALKNLQIYNANTELSIETIALKNEPKPIKASSVVAYLSDASAWGYPMDFDRLQAEIQLSSESAQKYAEAICSKGDNEGIGAVKRAVDSLIENADYGHIKFVAAAMLMKKLWFADPVENVNVDIERENINESSSNENAIDPINHYSSDHPSKRARFAYEYNL
jgi:ATP-dependent DNA helicase RecQ